MSNNFHRSIKFTRLRKVISWILSSAFIFGMSFGHLITQYPFQKARADSLTSFYDEDGASTTTTSLVAYTTKVSVGTLVSGTQYFLFVTMGLAHSSATGRVNYRIRYDKTVDEMLYTGDLEPASGAADQYTQVDWFDVYTPTENGTLVLEFKGVTTGTTSAINAVVMGLDLDDRLIENYDWYFGEDAVSDPHYTTMDDRATITLDNADGIKDWLVFGMEAIAVNNAAKNHRFRLFYNDTTASMTRWVDGEHVDDDYSFAVIRSFDNLARGDKIDIQTRDETLTGAENTHTFSRIFALNLQAFRDRSTHYQDVAQNLSSYSSWSTLQSASYSASSTGSHIMLGSYINDVANAEAESTNKLTSDGTIYPPNWDWSDGSGGGGKVGFAATDLASNNLVAVATLSTGTRTIAMSAQEISQTSQVNDEESLVVFSAEFNYMPRTNNWRWYADEEDATPGMPYAAENTEPAQLEIGKSIGMKLRINFDEDGGLGEATVNRKKIYYSTASDGSVAWTELGEAADTDALWRYYDGGGADNGALTSIPLTGTTEAGFYNESNATSGSQDQSANAITEFEYSIENFDAVANTKYYFAFIDETVGLIPPASGKSFPSITTAAAYTLTIDSAPSAADFGSWALGSSAYAEYAFSAPTETITIRDNRGRTGTPPTGDSTGWSLTADMTTEFNFCENGTLGLVTFIGIGLDDMSYNSVFAGCTNATYTVIVSDSGLSPDLMSWDDALEGAGLLDASTSFQDLNNGVQVKWGAIDGHTNTDRWIFTATVGNTITITKANTYWVTNTITGVYDGSTTGITGNSGEYMGSAVTAATVSGSVKQGLGGFSFTPTMRVYNAIRAGAYSGVLTFTLT